VGSWRSPSARGVFDVEPFWRGEVTWGKAPAVDIAEHEKAYEITVELPGMDESNIDVKFSDGTLTIKGEKKDEREEKQKDYHLSDQTRHITFCNGIEVNREKDDRKSARSRARSAQRRLVACGDHNVRLARGEFAKARVIGVDARSLAAKVQSFGR
jgi:hypothetical protein